MHRTIACISALLLVAAAVHANEAAAPADAPKALVIVPWKSSGLGDVLDVSRALDDGRQPVDRDVFLRELDYYEIRASSGAKAPGAQ